ncbi:MAG: T9SS type A sorting domain-containing protein, partial [Bacteroidetes bacterium]|nr:T9SS type A sorting domain-containing protein [Bacteroidota bacterium]
ANKTEWYLNIKTPDVASIDANIYPNPSTETAKIYFYLPEKDNIQLMVTDISGRILYQRSAITYMPGRNEISLPVQQFPTGLYLVSLVSEHARRTMKLDVIH